MEISPCVRSIPIGLGAAAEHLDRVRKHQLLGDPRHCVVIAANDEDADAGLVQAADLFRQEARGFHRGLVAVVEIAGKQQSVDLFIETQIDNPDEGAPRRVADQFGEIGVAQRQRPQGRVQMNVRRVDKPIGQIFCPLCHPSQLNDTQLMTLQ